ncbi:Kinase-like protein [Mycena sanguinolenta]|uniref:Kinase-like protein n=1 Tax=Mycena sanguinolenta TaxID=230812 RepID=A0A8H6U4A8_9AGAR|nr:Kinase-like protein [Mycena sanguinolenta]
MGGMQRRERRSRNTESLEQVSSAPGLAGQTLQEIIEDDHASLADTISEILYSPDCEGAVLALQNDSDAVQAVIDIFQHLRGRRGHAVLIIFKSNILVDDMGTACLTDFGLTVLSDVTASGSNYGAGSVRWMAPEALSPTMFKVAGSTRTPASDVYAFACLCVESYTGYPPFHDEFLYDAPVMLHVIDGGRPKRPTGVIPDHIWDIMNRCWEQDLTKRPTAQAITAELEMHTQIPVAELGNGPAITARQGLDYADESKMVMDTTNQNHPSTASLASEEEQYEAEVGSYRSTFVTAFWGGLTLAALTLAAMATS